MRSKRPPQIPARLPVRLYHATTLWVHPPTEITVELDLWFDTKAAHRFRIEGIDGDSFTAVDRAAVRHAMILLMGGKHLLVQTREPEMLKDKPQLPTTTLARVYFDYDFPVVPPGMTDVMGTGVHRVEVSAMLAHLAQYQYDHTLVLSYLNGDRDPESIMQNITARSAR